MGHQPKFQDPSSRFYRGKPASVPVFSSMAKGWAAALVGGAVLIGGYEGIQATRASSWEAEVKAAAYQVKGASQIHGREMGILAEREASSAKALEGLQSRAEAIEFLVGGQVDAEQARRSELIARERSQLNAGAKAEAAFSKILSERASGTLSNSDFIDAAQGALAVKAGAGQAVFEGAPGFASQPLADWEESSRRAAEIADAKERKLREELPGRAAALDADAAQAVVQSQVQQASEEAKAAARQEADAQIEFYRAQVKQSAAKAFDDNGESMGDDDWSQINADLENDPDWSSAKKGLVDASSATAAQAAQVASDQWNQEREHAVGLAQAVASQPDSVSSMSIWEMAMLSQWIDDSYIPAVATGGPHPQLLGASRRPVGYYARQGYSFSGTPQPGLDGASALRVAQGAPVSMPAPRYAPSRASLAIAGEVAGARADMPQLLRISQMSKNARDGIGQAMQAKAVPGSAAAAAGLAKAPSLSFATRDDKKFAWTAAAALSAGNAAKSASAKAQTVAVQAANVAARSAADRAAGSAVQNVASRAAANASGKAAQGAADRAAQSAAGKAAQGAADRAAQNAAGKAAQNAADRAARSAADKAAQSAANRAAQSAAAKAAQSASNKAAQAASSRAAATASTRSNNTSSSSGRR